MPSFLSIQFFSLFSALLVAYPVAARLRWRWDWALLGISVWVVGAFLEPRHFVAVLALTLGTWAFTQLLLQSPERARGGWLAGGIALLIATLALVKYPGFCSALGLGGVRASLLGTEALSPVRFFGLSYLVFRAIQIWADAASGALRSATLVQVANYLLFFPTFLCGPLERFQSFNRQFKEPISSPSSAELSQALFRVALGLLKKWVLLEPVARWTLFGRPGLSWSGASAGEILLGAYASVLYVYIDLSAYTDLAIGVSRFLGIRISENFDRPFLATSIQDFWLRWHLTLTNWIRDYIYTPIASCLVARGGLVWTLGGSAVATITAFFLMAVWHGEGWAFALYGLLQGVGLTLQLFYRTYLTRRHPAFYARLKASRVYLAISWVFTLHWGAFSMFLFLMGLRSYV